MSTIIKTPCRVEPFAGKLRIADADGMPIAMVQFSDAAGQAIADEIVKRLNSHDDLVAAVVGMLQVADRQTDEFDAARAALTKADRQKT